MRFSKHLYVSDSMTGKKEKIIRQLKSGRYPPGTHLLVLTEEGTNQLECYSTVFLRQAVLNDGTQLVVGLASGYDDALYLIEEIADEVYKNTGGADIRDYIKKREDWEN